MQKKEIKKAYILDTNVLIVANGREADHTSEDCESACRLFLKKLKDEGCLHLLDDEGEIWDEYKKYCRYKGMPGAGDAHFKWLADNMGNEKVVQQMELKDEANKYPQIPSPDYDKFDKGDRKFLALAFEAIKEGYTPIIINATDMRSWPKFKQELEKAGVEVEQLCC